MPEACTACDRSEIALRALADQGQRLTDLRRDVLKALHHSERPIGAYDLFDQLKKEGQASAPPAVYRVLDFLVIRGLAHKLPSLSAYAACKARPHAHNACFLICNTCGSVDEIADPNVEALRLSVVARGFKPQQMIVELSGICNECALQ